MSNVQTAVLDTIRSRRSIGRVKQDPIQRETIEALLEAATWAPCHYQTQPWKFIVMTGEGRARLGEGYARVAHTSLPEMSEEEREERLRKERLKAYRAPLVIAAVCSPSDEPRAVAVEELAAAHAAVQNLLLAAHAFGLGAIWRSGAPMYHPEMKRIFELSDEEQLVGFIYIGYPDMEPAQPQRAPISEKVVWLEE